MDPVKYKDQVQCKDPANLCVEHLGSSFIPKLECKPSAGLWSISQLEDCVKLTYCVLPAIYWRPAQPRDFLTRARLTVPHSAI